LNRVESTTWCVDAGALSDSIVGGSDAIGSVLQTLKVWQRLLVQGDVGCGESGTDAIVGQRGLRECISIFLDR
jgi:hypothetical protein